MGELDDFWTGRLDVVALYDGTTLQIHGPAKCEGRRCCFHSPSDHPLKDRPLLFRDDLPYPLMERICIHGVGHPDPDSVWWIETEWVERYRASHPLRAEADFGKVGDHGCEGCCAG